MSETCGRKEYSVLDTLENAYGNNSLTFYILIALILIGSGLLVAMVCFVYQELKHDGLTPKARTKKRN